jgi:hypothetical protein
MAKATADTEQNIAKNGPEDLALSDADRAKAMQEGAKEDVKETAKNAHHALTDGSLPGDPPSNPYHGHDEIQQYAHNLDHGVEAFEKLIAAKPGKDESAIPDEKVYGLLGLERNGKNRTPYVKAMMKRLKLKSDELPGGGPSHTNDITALTSLDDL